MIGLLVFKISCFGVAFYNNKILFLAYQVSYTIKDLEQLSGIKAHTLRIWEQRHGIFKPNRTTSNIRFYDDDDLKLLLNISLLNAHGLRISCIAEMNYDQICCQVIKFAESENRFCDQSQLIFLSMIELDELKFSRIFKSNILKHGLEATIINIIFPFLSRIGIFWHAGAVNICQEHFIVNLIRQKLMAAIDSQQIDYKLVVQKFMLFLPEGELHDISLIFANYMIRARGYKSIYLGQSTPIRDLDVAYHAYKPDYLFCIITTVPHLDQAKVYIENLCHKFCDSTLLFSGSQMMGYPHQLPINAKIITKIPEFIELLELI